MFDFKGTGVALVTPFDEKGNLDLPALKKLTEHVVQGGVNYLVPLGTTGESVTLTKSEKKEVLQTVLETNNNRIPVVVGIGGNNTSEVIKSIQETDFKGISGILSVSPYYNKPNQRGIVEHYKAVAASTDMPIILYNVPGRTGSNMLPETTLKLASEVKNIVAIKEASGNIEQMMQIIRQKPSDFKVISGDDNLTLPLLAAGGVGVISVVANIYPTDFSSMVSLCLQGKFEEARKLHYKLYEFTNLLFAEGNPSGAKAALSVMGICKNAFRLPVVGVSSTLFENISKSISNL